jgi:DNA polymerase-3 subunit delta'
MMPPEIVGHDAVRALLARAVAGQTLPHSLIFDGPDGVGKRTCALQLAAAVNCTARTDGTACGTCGVCRRIARGAHPDVVCVAPNEKGTIPVDVAREVIASASYRPFEARRRVVIIDEADRMQPPAQNALLKTLEEPPPSSMFVLVTSRVDALLITVRSRCPRLRFGRLTTEEVAHVLTATRGIEGAQALALAAVADGSVSRALAADAGDLDDARRVALGVLQGLAPRPSPAARLRVAQQLVESPKKKGGASERDLLGRRLDALAMLLRDVGGIGADANPRVLMCPDLARPLGELARHFEGRRLVEAFQLVDRARRAVERNQGAKVVADWLACEM